jgi:hypothetical protein
MKISDIFEANDPADDPDEDFYPDLKDLSKHDYTIRLLVSKHEIEMVDDDTFSKLITDIENDKSDDFIVWHTWEEDNVYSFDVAGTKGWQQLADVTKDLRKAFRLRDHSVSFFRPMKSHEVQNVHDVYKHMKYYSAQDLKVKL